MGSSGADLPVIIAQSGPLNGGRWAVSKPLVVGRDANCDVVVPDRQVSRFHARFTPLEEGVMLEDLGSKNGTFYDGNRVEEPIYLQDGSMVQIALVQNFVFLSSDATIPLAGGVTALQVGRLVLDSRSRRVWVKGQELIPPLSAPQFRLLQALYENPGNVVAREQLVGMIWGDSEAEGVSEEAIDALVRRLRDRLSAMDETHSYIITIRGHGLRLDNPEE